jgi:hypothetical protein
VRSAWCRSMACRRSSISRTSDYSFESR